MRARALLLFGAVGVVSLTPELPAHGGQYRGPTTGGKARPTGARSAAGGMAADAPHPGPPHWLRGGIGDPVV